MNFWRSFTFELVTPLEHLYPQMAYCEATPGQLKNLLDDVVNLFVYDKVQILFNIARKFGTISYSFMTFWGCFTAKDGKCAGIRGGRFIYYLLDFRNFFDVDEVETYYEEYLGQYSFLEDQYQT